jgi:hypothetical protein
MPYGGIYFVIHEFLRQMAPVIDGYLGLRSTLIGYPLGTRVRRSVGNKITKKTHTRYQSTTFANGHPP